MKHRKLQAGTGQAETLAELGNWLRQFRQEQELSLEDVASRTLIPVRILRAIEEGELDILPEPIYVQGFIRRYADILGINGIEFASTFPTEARVVPPQQSWISAMIETQLRPLHLYLLYTVIVVSAVSGLSYLLNRSNSQIARYDALQSTKPTPVALGPNLPDASSSKPIAANVAGSSVPAPSPLPSVSSAATPSPSSTSDQPVRVSLTLTSQSWVRVVADGKTEFEDVLPEGTKRTWTGAKEITIRAGNAGGVVVSHNESQPKAMGIPGDVAELTFDSNPQPASSSAATTIGTKERT